MRIWQAHFLLGCHVLKQSDEEGNKGEVLTMSGVHDYLEPNFAGRLIQPGKI